MKAFYLILLVLLWMGQVSAQESEKRISIQAQNKSLAKVLSEIEVQGAVRFSYNPRKINASQKINFNVGNATVEEALRALAETIKLEFTPIENQIIVNTYTKKGADRNETVTLSGYVKDLRNGEALIGATVYLPELETGTITNSYGFFSLTVPAGTYAVKVSYIGYQTSELSINLVASLKQDFALPEELSILEEVIITALPEASISETNVSQLSLPPKTIEERPALFGELDVIKSLESVPGIKLQSDGSTFYYVRGGNRDQNLILIDDSPIYNPSHLLGVFSTIIPDATTDITLYKGNMPASFGGRLSSVLDVHTRKGNDQFTQLWGNTGLISTKLGVEGPIKKDASSFLLSGRFSRLKWLAQAVNPSVNAFNFQDLTGKINFRINARNHAYVSFYSGGDKYFGENNGLEWKNTAATFRWTNQYSERLFINTTLSASGYDYFLRTDLNRNQSWNSHISNLNFKTDFSYFAKPQNEITYGIGLNGYEFNPGNITINNIQSSNVSARHSIEFVLYGNHNVQLNKHWGVNYGLRFTSWTNVGEAFEFRFNEDHVVTDTLFYPARQAYARFFNAEPRLTFQYLIQDNRSIKLGYARNVQNVHLISNSISPFTSLEVWLPSSLNIKPQVADQVTLGYYHNLTSKGIALSAETFFKYMRNQIDFETHAETLLNPLFEGELRFGSAQAYGIELLAKKDRGRLRGLMGYTFSRATRTFADLNNGKRYNALFDRPHQANVSLSYDLTKRWVISTSWNLLTGAPYTSPISFYEFNGLEVPVYGQKNNARMPTYHRLDVTATVKLNRNREKKYQHDLSLSIFNFYGRKNPLFINFNKEQLTENDFKIPTDLINSQYSISQFYLFQATPSISYNFRWR
jgi:CarboxypepD_reg-like domain/TonB-dependent Receptor Plug Domain